MFNEFHVWGKDLKVFYLAFGSLLAPHSSQNLEVAPRGALELAVGACEWEGGGALV